MGNTMINGQKVFMLANIYFGFDKYDLAGENKENAVSNASKLSALNADNS